MCQSPTKSLIKTASKQTGLVTIFILLIASLAAVGFIFNLTNSTKIKNTRQALVQAKDALIGFSVGRQTPEALANQSMAGAFPCPDTNNDGVADGCGASTYIGRLPWKTLGLSDLRDGDGECLWYVISPIFRNTIQISARGDTEPALNSATAGSITLFNDQAIALPAPASNAIATIIAPGAPLGSQSRVDLGSTVCGGNNTAANYLDKSMEINNATGNKEGNNLSLIMGTVDSTFNDRIIYITQEDLYKPLRKRVAKEIIGKFTTVKRLHEYYKVNNKYPCPAKPDTVAQDCTINTGFVPYKDSDVALKYQAWLGNNGWFGLTSYVYSAPDRVSLTVAGGASTSSCSANKNSMLCD